MSSPSSNHTTSSNEGSAIPRNSSTHSLTDGLKSSGGDFQTIQSLHSQIDRLRRELRKHISTKEISDEDMETVRQIFDRYDKDGDGFIAISKIRTLHSAMGEPLSVEESELAMEELSRYSSNDNANMIEFGDFVRWWIDTHKNDEGTSNFMRKFKLVNSHILDGKKEFDIENIRYHHIGKVGTLEYRLQFCYLLPDKNIKFISPWHDIPLYASGHGNEESSIFNFICEIPRYTRAKFEIATRETLNPIRQDVRNGRLRFYDWGDIMFNYGCLPQTWEDPSHIDEETKVRGDNDPIDVVEIGIRQLSCGRVCQVKVLGVLCLIDDEETDWKIIAIQVNDPMASILNDIQDVQRELPGVIEAIREYFRVYKVCHGKEPNRFGYDGKPLSRRFAHRIIAQTHESWKHLRSREIAPTE